MLQAVAPTIAQNYAPHLPKLNIVEEFTAGDAYLAHEQLVDVVGAR